VRMKFFVTGKASSVIARLTAVWLVCSSVALAQGSSTATTNPSAGTPSGAPAGHTTAPATGTAAGHAGAPATTGTTGSTVTTAHGKKKKKKKHKPVKVKKHKPPKHRKHRVSHHAGNVLTGGVSHVHKPPSAGQTSKLQKLENFIQNPPPGGAHTSKIGTPSNSLPPVSP
jgi:hypothetical protein